MALYFGNSGKLKLFSNNILYRFMILTEAPIVNGVKLLSSDNFILKDSNGLYLTIKEGE